ncbi:MAG: replication-associated recombination protein A [Chitinophagaceae bacterium]
MEQHHLPLAERLRPRKLEDLLGQPHLSSPDSILFTALRQKRVPSMILWGPPGTGKTSIAHIIAHTIEVPFYHLSAISSGVKELREVIDQARQQTRVVLFIDEIHRFNKGQQDALLGAVEKGVITLIGATTENPSFEVNDALLSRCQVYILRPVSQADLLQLLNLALHKDPWLKSLPIDLQETEALINIADGDARKLLNLLELVVESLAGGLLDTRGKKIEITNEQVMRIAQQRTARYDRGGEQHYDIISAFIKSIRGSDPNGAMYWLARMIEGGEEVKFIARRLVILASEDIGNANPTALVLATSTFHAVQLIGFPESRIILAQCTAYLAASPKSNSSYMAITQAQALVKDYGDLPVPFPLRNAPTGLMKEEGYGKGYEYAHDYIRNFSLQEYLPDEIKDAVLYNPGKNPREEEIRQFLRSLWGEKYRY